MPTVRYTVMDGEVASENRNGTIRDYVPDPLGSTIALLDQNQNITDTFSYWPYGEERTRTGTTPTPFRFVGTLGYYRDSSGRTYVRAREYQQAYGRWMDAGPFTSQRVLAMSPLDENSRSDAQRRWGRPQAYNYSKTCGVYRCGKWARDVMGGRLASTEYMCTEGPYGGCMGHFELDESKEKGLYHGTGKVSFHSDWPCRDYETRTERVVCRRITTNCRIAARVCECNKEQMREPMLYIVLPVQQTCFTYVAFLFDCACKRLRGRDKSECLEVASFLT